MGWSSDEPKYVGIMFAIAIAVAAAAAIVYFFYYIFAIRRRVSLDETKPFGVLCLSVQNADELYKENPKVAAATISNFNSVLSRNLFRFGCVRTLREGDVDNSEHINIIGMDPVDLLDLAIFIQGAVYKYRWGSHGADQEPMENIYYAFESYCRNPKISAEEYQSLWGGLRVRMALHFGYGSVTKNGAVGAAAPELEMDAHIYGGSVVKDCLFIEEHCFGGQILVSETFRELLSVSDGHSSDQTAVSSTSGSSSKGKGGGAFAFVPSPWVVHGEKVFASQLVLPGKFCGRRHPSDYSPKTLCQADRTKSQKRAALWRATAASDTSETPSIPDATTNGGANPMSTIAVTVAPATPASKRPVEAQKKKNQEESLVIFDEDELH